MNGIRTSAVARLSVAAMTACLLGAGSSAAVAAPSLPPTADEAGSWGDTKKWDDGLTVTTWKPTKFTPSNTAAGHEAENQAVKWRIKVHNGTDEPFDAVLMSVYVKSGEDGESCPRIFDSAKKLDFGIEGSVSPDANAAAEFAFDIPRGQLHKVDLEVVLGLDHDGQHWEGKVK
ncbi:hypothetical protein [Streptomyces longisporoflavus]|uniref:DUF4352 domain-containing protein n=1 Tax=Streptomyces longisporoflavus TaxID=28044 RepID=A0ABW7QUQ1_9ACTN